MEIWSEFGRRPDENGSAGTDHGAAGCGFVDRHARRKGEMVGEFPGLAALDEDDNLLVTSDFRGMYCTLLEEWLGEDATGLIPGEGEHAPLQPDRRRAEPLMRGRAAAAAGLALALAASTLRSARRPPGSATASARRPTASRSSTRSGSSSA